ncbi:HtaA domain-containing protein [Streptomyces sp. NPDC007172]|uniref:HtaA domain-containing protein n=1 Tax=Streptomyces sp. NPDC007172 TaxID=3364776 RepID=UPI0036B8E1E3
MPAPLPTPRPALRRRRSVALAAAVATAAALGAAVPAAAAPAPEGAPPQLELKDGTLDWGFRESFRKYIAAAGRITVADGAKQAAAGGAFTFTGGTGTYDTATHATGNAFKGSVRFEAHGGVLDIKLSGLKVATTGAKGAITADITTKDRAGKDQVEDDVALADLDLSKVRPGSGAGGAMVFKDIPAALTKAGAAAFNGQYKEGDPLDPATLTVTPVTTPDRPKPSEKPKPSDPPKPSGKPEPSGGTRPSDAPKPSGRPVSPSTPAPAPAGQAKVSDGRLTWGLKESFRRYINRGGGIKAADGAKKNGDLFDFSLGRADLDAKARTLDAAFKGSVNFGYPAHQLDMTFSDLKVKATGGKGTLVLDVTTPKGKKDDIAFATLDLSRADYTAKDGVVRLAAVPAAFTAEGAAAFANDTTGSMYKAGEAIDPLDLAFTVRDGVALPQGSGTGTGGVPVSDTAPSGTVGSSVGGAAALAATGSATPAGALLAAAGAVAAAGAAMLFAVRRRRA